MEAVLHKTYGLIRIKYQVILYETGLDIIIKSGQISKMTASLCNVFIKGV